jgi:hypothetical protein
MKTALLALLLLVRTASAGSLWDAELGLGAGVALGAGTGSQAKLSPVTIDASVAVAVNEEPNLSATGGLIVETRDRSSVGVTFGVRLQPDPASRLRLQGGGVGIVAPFSLWGARASAGLCGHGRKTLCGDLVLTSFLGGSDLASGHTVTQIQAVFGFAFAGP